MRKMRLFGKSTFDPVAAIEEQIVGLEKTKADLDARIPALETAKADALTRRRESLVAGAGSDEEAQAHRAAREADDKLAAVADALAEVERRLAEANDRLTQARYQVYRDAAAAELEQDCQAVDAAAKAARDALAAFRQATDELTKTITPLVAGQAEDMGWRVSPERVGTILAANLLATDLPAFKISTQSEIFEGHWHYGKEIEPKPEHAADPVGVILTGRLRSLAADIRTGAASPDLQCWSPTIERELAEPESQAA